jgi:ABC transporter substrate binding protein/GAF domain
VAAIARPKDGYLQQVASFRFPPMTRLLKPDRGSVVGRALQERRPVQIPDVLSDSEFKLHDEQKRLGHRTILGVPLLREGSPIGVIFLARKVVRPFTDKQIELVSTFADQAVIAIENVRLFEEIQDKSRQLAEASQHKSQFLANMSHELRTSRIRLEGIDAPETDQVCIDVRDKMIAMLDMTEVQTAARTVGLEVVTFTIRSAEDIAPTFDALKRRADALYVVGEPLVNTHRVEINTLAVSQRLPTIYVLPEYVDAGGLMSYGPNLQELYRRAADLVDKILRGTKPADIPVEQPTKFDLVVNLTTAKAVVAAVHEAGSGTRLTKEDVCIHGEFWRVTGPPSGLPQTAR